MERFSESKRKMCPADTDQVSTSPKEMDAEIKINKNVSLKKASSTRSEILFLYRLEGKKIEINSEHICCANTTNMIADQQEIVM